MHLQIKIKGTRVIKRSNKNYDYAYESSVALPPDGNLFWQPGASYMRICQQLCDNVLYCMSYVPQWVLLASLHRQLSE